MLSAAGLCGKYDELSWGYEFAGLEFNLANTEFRHTKPNGTELDSVELSVLLKGECLDSGVLDDPFTQLNVNIVVTGLDTNADPLMAAWHLDKHEGSKSQFHHPDYHFHYGGKKIWESEAAQGFSYGSLLLLESPRLDHKPLDGVLAVDFVLANFLGPAWRKLRDEHARYAELVLGAEKRCCRVYHEAALARLRSQF